MRPSIFIICGDVIESLLVKVIVPKDNLVCVDE